MIIEDFLTRIAARRPRIGVAGDSMIDAYYNIDVKRISPEFPIPVMSSNSLVPTALLPGGAANVCHQMRHFPVDHELISYFDFCAMKVFIDNQINFKEWSYPCLNEGSFNSLKNRFYADSYPFCRWDVEGKDQLPDMVDHFDKRFATAKPLDAIIISDYDKGFFSLDQSPGVWVTRAPITIIDPKKTPINRWYGCTVFKPNETEAAAMSGHSHWRQQCLFFLDQLDCKHVVITQAGSGVVGISRQCGEFEIKNEHPVHARSVVGAGDCFSAFLAMAMTCDLPIPDCTKIAFEASQCYVSNPQNKPITPRQLMEREDPIRAKFLPPDPKEKREGTLALANGVFDVLHDGHLSTMHFAKSRADKLIVALNSDASVKRLKGDNRPFLPLKTRMKIVANLSCVDHVVSFEEDTPERIIREIRPDIVVKASDWKAEDVVAPGCQVVIAPYVDGISTTQIAQKVRSCER